MSISVRIGWFWKGVRVVEGNSLENCRAGNGTEGSNPSPSARNNELIPWMGFLFLLKEGFEPIGRRPGSIFEDARQVLAPSTPQEVNIPRCARVELKVSLEAFYFWAKTTASTLFTPADLKSFATDSRVAPVVRTSSTTTTWLPSGILPSK